MRGTAGTRRANSMRPIDADALLENIEREYNSDHFPTDRDIMDCVRYAPTIDPVKHGRWIPTANYGGIAGFNRRVCSVCQADFSRPYSEAEKYCPNCGARMDGGANESKVS